MTWDDLWLWMALACTHALMFKLVHFGPFPKISHSVLATLSCWHYLCHWTCPIRAWKFLGSFEDHVSIGAC